MFNPHLLGQSIFLKFKNTPRACPSLHFVLIWCQQAFTPGFLPSAQPLSVPSPLTLHPSVFRFLHCPSPGHVTQGQQMCWPTFCSRFSFHQLSHLHQGPWICPIPHHQTEPSPLHAFITSDMLSRDSEGLGHIKDLIKIHISNVSRSWNTEVLMPKNEAINQNQTQIKWRKKFYLLNPKGRRQRWKGMQEEPRLPSPGKLYPLLGKGAWRGSCRAGETTLTFPISLLWPKMLTPAMASTGKTKNMLSPQYFRNE